MKKFSLFIIAGLTSITFWILESFIDLEMGKVDSLELLPKDNNELWMRLLIVILIMAMSLYAHISQARKLKIEREKMQLHEQLLHEKFSHMELILNSRKLTKEALDNFNLSVMSIKKKIDSDEVLSGKEINHLSKVIESVQNKLNRLWG